MHSDAFFRMGSAHDVCQDFLDQLSNMHCTPKSPTDPTLGTTWTKIHTGRPNDYGDCKKLAIITRALPQ